MPENTNPGTQAPQEGLGTEQPQQLEAAQGVPETQPAPEAPQQASPQTPAQASPETTATTQATQPQPAPAPQAQPIPQPMPQPVTPPAQAPSPTGALVCGILAIVFCFIPVVGIVLGIVAIVLAGKYFKAGGTLGQGKAGRICGIVGIVLSVIMMIVNAMLVFAALTVLDDYDTSGRYTGTEQVQRSDASSSAAASTTAEAAAAVEAVANAQLDLIKQKDPATMQQIQAVAEETFTDYFDFIDEGITMEDCGIVPSVFVDTIATGFDYEPSVAIASDSAVAGDEGSSSYDITCKSLPMVIDQTLDMMSEASFQTLSLDEQKATLGAFIMSTLDAEPLEEGEYLRLELTYDGSAWVIDQESWNDEMEYFFGF